MDHRREIWKDLNRSLYVGDRLKANLSVILLNVQRHLRP